MKSSKRSSLVFLLLALLVGLASVSIWLAGCTANEPFDPDSLENHKPEARLFVEPPADGDELNSTSYLDRTFNWSGTDRDGHVVEFYVSIQTEEGVEAPWDTTTATDTTMTFIPDENNAANVTFLIACLDNRGAYSDTLIQTIPMKNHPPTIIFKSDFEPKQNMQREYIYEGEAVVDTVYWNWGPTNFRCQVYDLDSFQTMDDFYRYTTAVDPENLVQEWDWDDPAADPETGWIVKPFSEEPGGGGGGGFYEFEIYVTHLAAGDRALTISVQDDVFGEELFQYHWQVREPSGPILYVPDNTSPSVGRPIYYGILDDTYGEGNWDKYEFVYGFPDRPHVLLETMRKFEAVLWTDGGSTSNVMMTASTRDGVLEQYIIPQDDSPAGRLLLVSKMVTGEGALGPSPVFIGNVLGINASTSSPEEPIGSFLNRNAEPQGGGAYLPMMAGSNNFGQGRGMTPLVGTEILYRMEYCMRCYNSSRPPFDPIVGIRRPERATSPLANVVCFSLQLEYFMSDQVLQVLSQVLTDEMGVVAR